MKKFLTAAGLALLGLALLGTTAVFADSGPEDMGEFPPVVGRLVEKFNLNRSEVEKELEDFRVQRQKDHHEEMEARFEDRLNEALEEGEITAAQKENILEKHEEIEEKMQETRDLAWEERREKRNEIREEMQTWIQNQDLDLDFLRLGPGPGRSFQDRGGFAPGRGSRGGQRKNAGFRDYPMAE